MIERTRIMKTLRISPLWWPLLVLLSPVLALFLFVKYRRYKKNLIEAARRNRERIDGVTTVSLPPLSHLDLTVLVESSFRDGFMGDAGVSYLVRNNGSTVLFDVAYGPDNEVLTHNADKLNISLTDADALVISHLHPDHMGGMKTMKTNTVLVPESFGDPNGMQCILPDEADAPGFAASVADGPGPVTDGIATTGPLARSLFFLGLTEEQALVARIEGKGLVVITGCGHPTVQVLMEMAEKMGNESIYAIVGGLHFPLTAGRKNWAGVKGQMLIGTGYPVWRRMRTEDLDEAADAINRAGVKQVLLSPHDTCDFGLDRFRERLDAEVSVLEAGGTYRIE